MNRCNYRIHYTYFGRKNYIDECMTHDQLVAHIHDHRSPIFITRVMNKDSGAIVFERKAV